ncbi:hypothetical protein BD779DRAFT_1556064 [Infundibulicybe gibba]|nr:hypothetical protein BD779DRAFT_1556064 [Infundibulicybe gibba]
MSKPSPVDSADTLLSPMTLFVGVILNWGLFWCLAVQVCKLLRNNFKVCFLFLPLLRKRSCHILCSENTGCVLDERVLRAFLFQDAISKATVVLPIVNGLISAIVQIFFSWCVTTSSCSLGLSLIPGVAWCACVRRIWFLNRTTIGRIFAVLIGIIAILQFIASLLLNKLLAIDNWWSNSFPSIIVMVIWLAGNFLADTLIASCMLYTLRVAQRQSLSKGAKTIISRLMVNTVQTGAITAVATGAGLAFKLFSPNNFQIITFILGPLFTNVCLANLNARARVRRLGNDPQFSIVRASERDPDLGRANTTLRFARQSTILAQSEATEP